MEPAQDTVYLGATDLRISPLGIGTMAWGGGLIWTYGRTGYTEADLEHAFQASLAAGINFFDTAEVYGGGKSEQALGRLIKAHQAPVVVATKFMPFPWRLQRQSLLDALKRSLDRLGLPQVDLYQIHWPLPPVPITTWMAALADAIEAGLARAVGVSNYDAEQMRRAHAALAQRGIPLASNQVQYSLLARAPERNGLLAACRELGITLIAYSPLAQGLLTGKYDPANPPSGALGFLVSRRRLAQIQPLIALLREIGQAHGKTPSQVALNWLICKGAVPIPGAKTGRQAQENTGALGWRLTEAEVAALDATSEPLQA